MVVAGAVWVLGAFLGVLMGAGHKDENRLTGMVRVALSCACGDEAWAGECDGMSSGVIDNFLAVYQCSGV